MFAGCGRRRAQPNPLSSFPSGTWRASHFRIACGYYVRAEGDVAVDLEPSAVAQRRRAGRKSLLRERGGLPWYRYGHAGRGEVGVHAGQVGCGTDAGEQLVRRTDLVHGAAAAAARVQQPAKP